MKKDKIKKLVVAAGDRTELAKELNIHKQTIWLWIQRNQIPVRYIEKVCKIAEKKSGKQFHPLDYCFEYLS